ncbi:hypothetical protein EZ313_04220 [Ramlibacter henchirensis]|uniref:Lipoprotein n=1 Tax=Ramlibacter henchirensis TaxID=204072 RepID=A0A4Z0C2T1_9BURK|nr:hypothetical protein [Ramlibacter henchirensis]TFZ05866.1 hypothetical protein EZ313_04220 [Ramlibacter henchirensis]
MKAGVVGACAALLAVANAAAEPQRNASWRNATTGAPLKPGIYGRIEVRGEAPPLVHAKPVVAKRAEQPAAQDPVYLYVPPGQLRRWADHCAKWQACERPVYFVRMDGSPSRLGEWKKTQRPQPQASLVRDALDLIASR